MILYMAAMAGKLPKGKPVNYCLLSYHYVLDKGVQREEFLKIIKKRKKHESEQKRSKKKTRKR